MLATFDALPLRHAIHGLFDEMNAATDPVAIQHWVELIQRYVLRFSQPWNIGDPLAKLWDAVDQNLGAAWNIPKLCQLAHCSGEQLRRLCHRHLGRSPMHQVTYLRMRRASALLEKSDDKIQTVAETVGYSNPFTFSSTFKKWIGWPPSVYRGRREGPVQK